MTTTALELTPDAAQILAGSAPQDRLNIETMISHLITQFPSMSNRMPNRELYEQDFFAWTQTTAALLRAGTIQDIDWYILAEEIESTGKSERRALGSQIQRLTMHLLKWRYQPSARSNSWRSTIRNARLELQDILEDSPSLEQQVAPLLEKHYPRARADAIDETGIEDFPQDCPWTDTKNELLNPDFWPEAPSA